MVNITNFENEKNFPWTILNLNKGRTCRTSLNIEEHIFIMNSGFLTTRYANVDVILSPTKLQNSAFLNVRKTKFEIHMIEYWGH